MPCAIVLVSFVIDRAELRQHWITVAIYLENKLKNLKFWIELDKFCVLVKDSG